MWLTRLTVPAELRSVLNKRELKRSLRTKSEREARLQHPIVLAEFQAELERARRTLESESLLTDAVIKSIIFEWRKSVATSFAGSANAVNPYLNRYAGLIEENNAPVLMVLDDFSSLDMHIKKSQKDGVALKPEIIKKKHDKYFKQLNVLLSNELTPYLASFQITPIIEGNNYRKLLREFAVAYVELTQSALKREISNLDLVKQGVELIDTPSEVDVQGFTVEDLWEEYKATLTSREPDRAEARIRTYSAPMNKFLTTYSGRTVTSIKKRDVAKFRLLLEKLPVKPNAKIKALPLAKQIEKADEEKLPRTSATSVRNQINAISAVFTYGVSQDYIDINPVIGTVSDIKTSKSIKGDKGFNKGQITTIFSSKLFHDNYGPVKADYGRAHYWIPILLYYTGARVEEIAQLHLSDIKLTHEVPHLVITNEQDDQSLKNDGSVRAVPLHNHVIELGFADYVGDLPSSGRLFPKLTKTGTDKKYNTRVRVWFSKYLRDDLGVNHKGMKPMHGFRHTFITMCRELNVRNDVQNTILGHSQSDVSGQYGSFSLKVKNELVQSIPKCFTD